MQSSSTSYNVLWLYASHGRRLLDRKADEGSVRAITRQYRVGPLLYLAGFLLAFVNVPLSIGTYLLLALYFALPGSAIDRARG